MCAKETLPVGESHDADESLSKKKKFNVWRDSNMKGKLDSTVFNIVSDYEEADIIWAYQSLKDYK